MTAPGSWLEWSGDGSPCGGAAPLTHVGADTPPRPFPDLAQPLRAARYAGRISFESSREGVAEATPAATRDSPDRHFCPREDPR